MFLFLLRYTRYPSSILNDFVYSYGKVAYKSIIVTFYVTVLFWAPEDINQAPECDNSK